MRLSFKVFIVAIAALLLASIIAPQASAEEPQLLNGGVSSTASDESAVYVFMVTYKGNVSALTVKLILNGNSCDMLEFDASDSNSSDGKVYYYNTRLKGGMNTYSFTCADADSHTNATAAKMILVKETPFLSVSHLDVMLALFIFVPFVIYFVWLARRMTKTLERIEKKQGKDEKEQTPPPGR